MVPALSGVAAVAFFPDQVLVLSDFEGYLYGALLDEPGGCTSIIFSVTYSKFYALSCAVFGSSIFERFCKNLTNFVRCVLKYSPCICPVSQKIPN